MTTPQLENGYTKIANELLDELIKIRIAGEARQVLDFIIRKTYGFNKKKDRIALSQFCLATGMQKSTVARAIRKLRIMKLIKTIPDNLATIYEINKNYNEWEYEVKYNRMKIFERDSYICHHCGKKFIILELEVDHLIPLWLNGSNKEENLVTSCVPCNRKRGIKRVYNNDTVSNLKRCQNSNAEVYISAQDPVTKMTHTKDNTTKDNTKDNSNAVALRVDTPIISVIDGFKIFNKAAGDFYGNKTQRGFAQKLVDTYGQEKVDRVIAVLPVLNRKLYNKATTPKELWDKWAKIEAEAQGLKEKRGNYSPTKIH